MFSQHNQSAATNRTSRRRPRPSSGDNLPQPKAKRQRSTLSEDSSSALYGKSAVRADQVPTTKTTAVAQRESLKSTSVYKRELSVRSKKPKTIDRSTNGDGSTILTKNDVYSVSRLPAWPSYFQSDPTIRQHGAIYAEFGYALSLSHEHAIIWPYAGHTTNPETFTFLLPGRSNPATDPLPLGTLVAPPTGTPEPGLVVVIPSSGKIIYWESIASAATTDLAQQQRHAVASAITGTFTGERAVQILNAESAGFILSFSSGRIAYLSVRDNQNKPAITLQFLKRGTGSSSSGIFGPLRNALQGSVIKGDLVACRVGPITRPGERRIVSATTKGRVQIWNLHRSGHNTLVAEAELAEAIFKALLRTKEELSGLSIDSFEIRDLTLLPSQADEPGQTLLMLTSVSSATVRGHSSRFAIVKVKMSQDAFEIGTIRHLKLYTNQTEHTTTSKPRLYLPAPGLVAFAVFDRATVVVSVAEPRPSPDSQLRLESHVVPNHYEDVIDLRQDVGCEIVGSGVEEIQDTSHNDDIKPRKHRTKHAAVLLLVRGVGIIRITALDNKTASQVPSVVTAKSKLEQAVFFGAQDGNPLSFRGRDEVNFPHEEIQAAALALSKDIVRSASPYIPSTAISVEQHLRQRQVALKELANHLLRMRIPLDRAARWTLLAMAEKIAAASKCWNSYDAQLRLKTTDMQPILQDIVLNISEDQKTDTVEEAGELDRVRHWFVHDIDHIEIALAWAREVLKNDIRDNTDASFATRRCSQAVDLVLGSLKAAYTFRAENLSLYQLTNENVVDGIIYSALDYADLPSFWTSTSVLVKNFNKLCETMLSLANTEKITQTDNDSVQRLRVEAPEMVDINITLTTENYRWMLGQQSEKSLKIVEEGMVALDASIRAREEQITRLADMKFVEEAITIAEKHRVFNTLALLLVDELFEGVVKLEYVKKGGVDSQGRDTSIAVIQNMEDRIMLCINKYGKDFSYALYKYYLEQGKLHTLIIDRTGKDSHLREFLRSNTALAKLAWINEIKSVQDYDNASFVLFETARSVEQDVWAKKVEYSIGKLARLSGKTYSQKDGLLLPDGGRAELLSIDGELAMLGIQETAHQYIATAIVGAIDENAELDLAEEIFGSSKTLSDKDGLKNILSERLSQLIRHEVMTPLELVDLLTLIDTRKKGEPVSFGHCGGQEFYMALKVLQEFEALGHVGVDVYELHDIQLIIWRRCILYDDWQQLNDTSNMTDQDVKDRLHDTALYSTLRACIKNGLFDGERSSSFVPFTPSECIKAGTQDRAFRYTAMDTITQEQIRDDERKASSVLQHYVSACQIERWHHATLEEAKHRADTETQKKTESGITMREFVEDLEIMEAKIIEESQEASRASLKGRARYAPKLGQTGMFQTSTRV